MKRLATLALCATLGATSVQAGGAAPPPTSGGGGDAEKVIIGGIVIGLIYSLITSGGAPASRDRQAPQPGVGPQVGVDSNGGTNAGLFWKF